MQELKIYHAKMMQKTKKVGQISIENEGGV